MFCMTVGALTLCGWILDIPAVTSLGSDITMKANAAIGLLATGLALRLTASSSSLRRGIGRTSAVLAGALGAATLSEHVVGWNLGIDQFLFLEEPGAPATMSPGRMGPNSSTSLTLAAVAILSLYRNRPSAVARAQILGAVMAVLALVPTIGYLYGARELYTVARYTGIALPTGIALLVLSIGVLMARTDVGPMAAVMSERPHGVMARRLLVPTILVPLFLGYLRVVGERLGLYDVGLGASLFVVSTMVLLSATIWRTAVALAQSDRARQTAEEALSETEQDRDELLIRERAAREEAERAVRAKDDFIAALSHELRTPLNAILGWMQMLQQNAVPDGRRAEATRIVTRNAGMLARLIEDLLDVSRISMGQLELAREAVNVNAIVHAAAQSVAPAADGRRVRLVMNLDAGLPLVVGDAQRLQQVVWNVLTNAIKFSAEGSAVEVRSWADPGRVCLSVTDRGIGIDPPLLAGVFERFRHGAAPGAGGGLGLGLSIVKHLTELHGGTVRAHSEGRGTGATFTIELPAAPAAAAAVQSASA